MVMSVSRVFGSWQLLVASGKIWEPGLRTLGAGWSLVLDDGWGRERGGG